MKKEGQEKSRAPRSLTHQWILQQIWQPYFAAGQRYFNRAEQKASLWFCRLHNKDSYKGARTV